jgi:rare lipoprotein A (peptidoglycan hydrolase)
MLRQLYFALAFSVAPWTETPLRPRHPAPDAAPFVPDIDRPAPMQPPLKTSHPKPPVVHREEPPPAPRIRHTRLMELREQELSIWRGILKTKTAAGFYQLGAVRFELANEQRRLKLINPAQYRHYLLKKAVTPLKLNLRKWGHAARNSEGTPYDVRSISLLNRIMAAVKSTVRNSPLRDGEKIQKGRVTHYGGEKIYGNEPYPEFHGKPTAVGETFCMFGQTCAYMRAPLNSWIRVVNPHNGKFVDLRVTDTGPFESNGILADLSRGGHHVLGIRDRQPVMIRRIRASEAIPEPLLCTGRGHAARNPEHLSEKHFSAPSSWR